MSELTRLFWGFNYHFHEKVKIMRRGGIFSRYDRGEYNTQCH